MSARSVCEQMKRKENGRKKRGRALSKHYSFSVSKENRGNESVLRIFGKNTSPQVAFREPV